MPPASKLRRPARGIAWIVVKVHHDRPPRFYTNTVSASRRRSIELFAAMLPLYADCWRRAYGRGWRAIRIDLVAVDVAP
jgi:hypothetical protein